MKIGLITYAVDLAALAKKPPPGGETVPLHPHCLGETGLRDGQCNRPARYGTMGSVPDSTVTAPGIS
jgi:hypothetical protein